LSAARSNADAMMQISTRMLDTWIDFVQRNSEMSQTGDAKAS